MLEDSAARFAITDREDLSLPCPALVPESLLSGEASSFHPPKLSPDDPAYLIYTSGSTGRPKGTVIPHRGIVRLVRDTDYIEFGPEETFLLSSPVTFDASTLELWGPLLNGGRLAVLSPGTPSLAEIGDAIRRFNVTTLWLTSGLFQLMVDERLEDLAPLRQLLVGGDVVSRSHAALAIETLKPEGKLFNGYGPTENTTFTTVHPISLEDTTRSSLPIGKPIGGTTVYLLDDELNPVPRGVKGRLYLGGNGLALGYLNQPEATAKAFLKSPFHEGSLLYDSGDFGRWLSDGSIEFLGRGDDQVKIRGFRIETGEIEGVLEEHPEIRRSAIVLTGDSAEDKQLHAFLLPEPDADPDSKTLLAHTKERLPAYMVPSQISFRQEFPLTKNGKVDYRRLREMAVESDPAEESPGVDPDPIDDQQATKTERAVAALWSEILQVGPVQRDDDFFALGGHSLAGLRLFTRLQDQFGVDLPLATLFQSSTVAALSTRIDARRDRPSVTEMAPNLLTRIRSGNPEEAPLFLVHGGDGGTLFYKDFADRLKFDGEIYTIEAPILIDPNYEAAETSMEETAQLYLDQIRSQYPDQSFHLGGYSFGGAVAYEMALQLEESSTPINTLILFDTPNPAREQEFKNGFPSRLVSDWRSQDDDIILKQVRRFGV
ncbi:MAG: AMP-binding protein, partial [Verrucomicrobiota bacterium]